MKNIILATFIAILFALSFVSCDKADNPWGERDRFFVQNQSSKFLAFEGASCRFFLYNKIYEFGLEELNIANDKWVMGGDLSIRWGSFDSMTTDSILALKNYVFYPTRHETVKDDTVHMMYYDHYYIFTDSVLRDMKSIMKIKGILPQKVEE